MYLLTFAFLIIAMLGIYTQVYALQTARLFASQTGIAQSLLTWHAAAVSMAGNVVEPATAAWPTGCSLTATATPWTSEPAVCLTGGSIVTPGPALGAAVNLYPSYKTLAGNKYPTIPSDYKYTPYSWKSIAYQDPSNNYYVVTYVDPSTGKPPRVTTASSATIPFTTSDLFQQLRNTGSPLYSYGWVSNPAGAPNATLTVPAMNGVAGPSSYTLPSSIPNGALAIISSPGQCNGC